MIARRLLNELQQLNREEKLEVLCLLQDELADESSELDELLKKAWARIQEYRPHTRVS